MARDSIRGAVDQRVHDLNWQDIWHELDEQGNSVLGQVLFPEECVVLAGLYLEEEHFRSRMVMGQHGFGRGEYKYFHYPLPKLVAELRTAFYPHLVPIANRWNLAVGRAVRYPERHGDFIERCHGAGQVRPTPLLLQYRQGDYNCLHQDLYGEHVFPIQIAILLSAGATG